MENILKNEKIKSDFNKLKNILDVIIKAKNNIKNILDKKFIKIYLKNRN